MLASEEPVSEVEGGLRGCRVVLMSVARNRTEFGTVALAYRQLRKRATLRLFFSCCSEVRAVQDTMRGLAVE
jgi:hypothetical protein